MNCCEGTLRHLAERAISPFMCSEKCAHSDEYTQAEALQDLESYLRQALAEDRDYYAWGCAGCRVKRESWVREEASR